MLLGYIHWSPNPEIVNIFGISIRYYGVLFIGSYALCIYILRWVFRRENIPIENLDKLSLYGLIGVIAGARLGHCFFYWPSYYLANPLEIFLPFTYSSEAGFKFTGYQGLASHGGVVGLMVAMFFYCRKTKHALLDTFDLIAVVGALVAMSVRIANLINSEILGIPTDKSWAFVFEQVDNIPRHPVQIYEGLSYFLIFLIMVFVYTKYRKHLKNGFLSGLVLVLIFSARFVIEFYKETQTPFEENMILYMGQILSIPYILLGTGFMIYGWRKTQKQNLSK